MGLHCAIVSSAPTPHSIGTIFFARIQLILVMRENYICVKLKAPSMVRHKKHENNNVESAALNTLVSNEVTDKTYRLPANRENV